MSGRLNRPDGAEKMDVLVLVDEFDRAAMVRLVAVQDDVETYTLLPEDALWVIEATDIRARTTLDVVSDRIFETHPALKDCVSSDAKAISVRFDVANDEVNVRIVDDLRGGPEATACVLNTLTRAVSRWPSQS